MSLDQNGNDMETTFRYILFYSITFVFLCDLILWVVVHGPKGVLKHKMYILEVLLQLTVAWEIYISITIGTGDNFNSILNPSDALSLTLLLRCVRLIEFFTEIEDFAIIRQTSNGFQKTFFSLLMALFLVFYVYAGIGQFFFSGLITTQSDQVLDPSIPALYYLMNFNDFGMSMVTLFHIMVVNNWWVTTNMLCLIAGS